MSAAATRPLRRDAARNRDRLLAAASHVFAVQGLDASVTDIAREAGVGMGTLYRRFATKEALIDALLAELLGALIDMAQVAQHEPAGGGLEQFLRESSAYQADHLACLPRVWTTDHPLIQRARELIAGLLADAKAHGRVRPELTGTDVTVAMWSIRGILETTRDQAPHAWQRHLEVLLAGFRPADQPLVGEPLTQAEIDRILTPTPGDPTRGRPRTL